MKKLLFSLLVFLILSLLSLVFWVVQPIAGSQKLENVPNVDEASLQQHVEMLSVTLSKRNFWDINTLDQAAQYIEKVLAKTTTQTSLQSYQVDGQTFSNVIARFGPKEGEPIIIGAHYDAYEETAGADDNASGVAGLLALATLLKENPPSIPVELVAYTLEEPPNFRTNDMGSRRHAATMVANGIEPKLVVVLEMIGYFSDGHDTQHYPFEQLGWVYPDEGNFIAVVSHFAGTKETRLVKSAMQSATDLPVVSINAPSLLTGIDFSDHASYWQHDIPAIMVTDTSFYRNPHYHKPSDLPSTLDYKRMAKVVQGVYGVIKSQAN